MVRRCPLLISGGSRRASLEHCRERIFTFGCFAFFFSFFFRSLLTWIHSGSQGVFRVGSWRAKMDGRWFPINLSGNQCSVTSQLTAKVSGKRFT